MSSHRLALPLGVLASVLALSACSPRETASAPPPGYDVAMDEAPPPELLGGPDDAYASGDPYADPSYGAEPRLYGPGEPIGPEAYDQAQADLPPYDPGFEPEPTAPGAEPAPWPAAPTRLEPEPAPRYAQREESDADVIGRPARPRVSGRVTPPAETSAAAPAPEPRGQMAALDPVAAPAAAPSASAATGASTDAALAPAAGMAPIPNPPEPARPVAPARTGAAPAPRQAAPVARASGPAPSRPASSRPATPSAPASLTPVQTLTGRLAQQVSTSRLEGAEALKPGRTGDVVLQLPATLGETLAPPGADRQTRRNAANARVSATLTGEGYAIDPSSEQISPLEAGKATTFRWKVTPESDGGRSPLSAKVEAQIGPAASRQTLDLGEVRGPDPAAAAAPTTEGVGAAWVWWLLGFLFVVLVGGLTLLRGGQGKTAEVRRREPLDLRGDPARSTP